MKAFLRRAVPFFDGIGQRRITAYAAAGTFYFFMSLVPVVMILCSVLPHTFLTEDVMLAVADTIVPDSVYPLAQSLIGSIYTGEGMSISISVVITAWSASLTMAALMRGMALAYGTEHNEHFLLFRLRAVLYMAVLLASTIALLGVIVFGQQLILLALSYFPSEQNRGVAFVTLKYARYPVMFLLLTAVLALLYRLISGAGLRLRRHLRGAAFTSCAWLVISAVFSFYVTNYTNLNLFGILGTVIIAMLWLYYCLLLLLIGGYINSRYAERKR